MNKFQSGAGLLVSFVLAFAVAAIGAIASVNAAEFYRNLALPPWAPPASVFGPVWTFLYCCMAVASWLVWREPSASRFPALLVYCLQMVLNALWSWIFFAWKEGRWALIEVLVLWALILLTIVLFWRVRKAAALLLLPYFVWVTFASCLTFALWKLNPGLQG